MMKSEALRLFGELARVANWPPEPNPAVVEQVAIGRIVNDISSVCRSVTTANYLKLAIRNAQTTDSREGCLVEHNLVSVVNKVVN